MDRTELEQHRSVLSSGVQVLDAVPIGLWIGEAQPKDARVTRLGTKSE